MRLRRPVRPKSHTIRGPAHCIAPGRLLLLVGRGRISELVDDFAQGISALGGGAGQGRKHKGIENSSFPILLVAVLALLFARPSRGVLMTALQGGHLTAPSPTSENRAEDRCDLGEARDRFVRSVIQNREILGRAPPGQGLQESIN